jgi:hypothetical protein
MIMNCTDQQADELLLLVRPLCVGLDGNADLCMGVDLLNGMLSKFYYDDEAVSLDIGNVTKESVKKALMAEDSLTIQHFIEELQK